MDEEIASQSQSRFGSTDTNTESIQLPKASPSSLGGFEFRGSKSNQELARLQQLQSRSLLSTSCFDIPNTETVIVERIELEKDLTNFHQILHQTLTDFILVFIVDQPKDVIDFAVQHFTKLQDVRKANAKKNSISNVATTATMPKTSTESTLPKESKTPRTTLAHGRRHSVCSEPLDQLDLEDDDEDNIPDNIADNISDNSSYRKSIILKSRNQHKNILKNIKDLFLFRKLSSEQLDGLLEVMNPMYVDSGDVIVRHGEEGNNFYIIETGTFKVLDKHGNVTNTLVNKGTFGELALLYNIERAETVVASSNGYLWVIDNTSFRRILLQQSSRKQKRYTDLLRNVPMFKELNSFELLTLTEVLKTVNFRSGNTIFKQGDDGDGMYFIEEGLVSVWRDPYMGMSKSTGEKLLAKLGKDKYFGELAIILKRARRASVYAETDTKLAFLDKDSFERLLGKCIDILNRNMEDYNLKDPGLIAYLTEVRSKKSTDTISHHKLTSNL